jgi:ATP-binding cassette subfamily B protein
VIFVLDHGQVVERGSHDQLLQRGGLYARLYEEQFGGGAVQAFCSDGIVLADGRCVRPAMADGAAGVDRSAVTDGRLAV